MSIRPVKKLATSQPAIEGAGVHLRRAFGFGDTSDTDPFLLFDDFRNDRPEDYLAGSPWHPHRGIETITHVLAGNVEHGDSLGNTGRLGRAHRDEHRGRGEAGICRLQKREFPQTAVVPTRGSGDQKAV